MDELNTLHGTGRKGKEKTRKRKREGNEDEGQFWLATVCKNQS